MRWVAMIVRAMLIVGASACATTTTKTAPTKPRTVLSLDVPRATATMNVRMSAAVSTREVHDAFNALWQACIELAGGTKRGEALIAQIGGDPSVQTSAQQLLGKFGSAEFIAPIIASLMRHNPQLNATTIGPFIALRITAISHGPMFDAAWERASPTLMSPPEVTTAISRLSDSLVARLQIGKLIHDALGGTSSDAIWLQRLTALNGGRVPDEARTTDLFLDHVFTRARLVAFMVKFASLPGVRNALVGLLSELAESPALKRITVRAIQRILEDPEFQKQALEALRSVILDEPTEDLVAAQLTRVLETPVVRSALVEMLNGLAADAEVQAIAERAATRLSSDPGMLAAIATLCDPTE